MLLCKILVTHRLDLSDDNYEELHKNLKDGRLIGETYNGNYSNHPRGIISLANVSHVITNIYSDLNLWWLDVEILDTPQGKILEQFINNNVRYSFCPRFVSGTGEVLTFDCILENPEEIKKIKRKKKKPIKIVKDEILVI